MQPKANEKPQKWIGILLFDGMEEIDGLGPWEVLAWWTNAFPEDGWATTTFSATGEPVTCDLSLVVTPHHSFESVPPLDVLVHPGGDGAEYELAHDDAHLDWLRKQRSQVGLMTSVCTGSLPLAAAGLLRGRPATTARTRLDVLKSIDDSIHVRRDARFVDDGDIITAGGLSAGMDMALHLVGRLAGSDRARQVREGIEYAPQPPH
jgi:transcriptional regulator GlxA family with amidase domain